MIDYFFKFTNEAAAIADASGSQFYFAGQWNPDRVIPNVQVWRASQDVGGVHTFLSGWYAIVSLPDIRPALVNHAALQLALNRDEFNGGRAGIIKSNVLPAILQDIRFAPIFAGASYPFGSLN